MQAGFGGSSGNQSGTTTGSTNTLGNVNQTGTSNVNQTGTSTGATTGTTAGTTTGTTTGTQTGTSTGATTGTQTGTTGAVPTGLWGNFNQILGTNVGGQGLTGTQTGAISNMQNFLSGPNSAQARISGTLPQFQAIANAPATQIGGVGQIAGQRAAPYMSAYQNPYESQVVGSALGDLENAYLKNQNQLRAQYGGQGWSPTAGAGSGLQLAAAQGADDYLRNVGATSGNLRSAGFNTALGAGQADAGRVQGAGTQNIANQLAISTGNAGLQEQQYGRGMDALSRIIGGAATGQNAVTSGNQQIYGMSGGGLNQIIAALNAQTPAFGTTQTGTQTGASTGSQTGAQTGTTAGTQTGTTAGTSVGSTTGATTGASTSNTISDILAQMTGTSSGYSSGRQSGASLGGKS